MPFSQCWCVCVCVCEHIFGVFGSVFGRPSLVASTNQIVAHSKSTFDTACRSVRALEMVGKNDTRHVVERFEAVGPSLKEQQSISDR